MLPIVTAAFLAAGFLGYNSSDRKNLRAHKARLAAMGEKLKLSDLARPLSEREEASTAILAAIGERLNALGLSPGNLELMNYVAPGRAKVAWKQDSPPWMPGTPGGTAVHWQEFEKNMAEAAPSLEALRIALRDPPGLCRPPLTNLPGRIPNFVNLRVNAQWLSGDTIRQLRQGRTEQALQDIEALASCAQVARDDFTLVAQMIRIAIAGLGLSATWEALQAPDWTEPQLVRLQKAWEPVDLVEPLEKGFVGTRVGGAEVFAYARKRAGVQRIRELTVLNPATNFTFRSFVSDHVLFPAYKITCIDQDELFYLESFQSTLDSIRRIKQGQPWNEVTDGLDLACARLNSLSNSPARYRYWVSSLVLPNFTRAIQSATRNETLRQLTLTAIAIKRFQLQRGTLPRDLAALTPDYLSKPGYDPLAGGALHYSVKGNSGFLLYSVGQDGRDDGGEAPPGQRPKYGLWVEPDAVWPQARDSDGERVYSRL